MPGDAIIMSCFYKPHPDRDIVGGWNTEHEMCDLIFGLAPEVETFAFGLGWMVRPTEEFRNSFMGSSAVGATAKTLDYTQAIYRPNPEGRNFVPLEEHRLNVCELAVRGTMELQEIRWSSPQIPSQIYFLAAFFVFCFAYQALGCSQRIQGERKRRNTVVYLVELVFSLFSLPVISWSLASISAPSTTFDAVNPETYPVARGLIVAQSALFLIELFYRIRIRLEVMIHHVLAVILVIF